MSSGFSSVFGLDAAFRNETSSAVKFSFGFVQYWGEGKMACLTRDKSLSSWRMDFLNVIPTR